MVLFSMITDDCVRRRCGRTTPRSVVSSVIVEARRVQRLAATAGRLVQVDFPFWKHTFVSKDLATAFPREVERSNAVPPA